MRRGAHDDIVSELSGCNPSLCTSPGHDGRFRRQIAFQNLIVSEGDVPPPPPAVLEIWEIQGAGQASPYDGSIVTTEENVVTAVGTNGFFIQTSDQ